MTVLELAERDLKKAKQNLVKAVARPGVPHEELNHIRELMELRAEIVEIIRRVENGREKAD